MSKLSLNCMPTQVMRGRRILKQKFLSHSSKMIAEFLSTTTLEIFNHIDFCQPHFFTKFSNLYWSKLNLFVLNSHYRHKNLTFQLEK